MFDFLLEARDAGLYNAITDNGAGGLSSSVGEMAENQFRVGVVRVERAVKERLSMAESERYLPQLVSRIEGLLEQHGLAEQAVTIRMTGCPNGCARPSPRTSSRVSPPSTAAACTSGTPTPGTRSLIKASSS